MSIIPTLWAFALARIEMAKHDERGEITEKVIIIAVFAALATVTLLFDRWWAAHRGEVDALVDCVLAVSGQNLDDDDLVTLLWESNLRHVDIDYIPAQGDVGGGEARNAEGESEGPLLPWPMAQVADEAPPSTGPGADDGNIN